MSLQLESWRPGNALRRGWERGWPVRRGGQRADLPAGGGPSRRSPPPAEGHPAVDGS